MYQLESIVRNLDAKSIDSVQYYQCWYILKKMNLIISTAVILLLISATAQSDIDSGQIRLQTLRKLSLSSPDRIINLSSKDFDQYIMHYPRPYDIVIYFYAKQIPLSEELYPEYNYTVQLFSMQGAIDSQKNPTFFARMDFNDKTNKVWAFFGFQAAPNMVVSRPNMAFIRGQEFKSYIKNYNWRISSTDGVVTTRKMLQFVNKRTDKDIVYQQSQQTIKYVLSVFLAVSVCGVIVYKLLRVIWGHWFFWFFMSMIIYLICMTGIVHCVLNGNIPEELKMKGKISFFSHGKYQQSFFEGCLVSGVVSLTGIVLIIIAVTGEKIRQRYSAIIGILGLVLVFYAINYIQLVYTNKSWYGPSFQPPSHYLRGPLSVDQGNNI